MELGGFRVRAKERVRSLVWRVWFGGESLEHGADEVPVRTGTTKLRASHGAEAIRVKNPGATPLSSRERARSTGDDTKSTMPLGPQGPNGSLDRS